ncbi:hypothetical protein PoB_000366500 [Plakobranchus ocellatus]|uniref:Uncharacterized protein n=1 Tax=Plakobranchus ocellatus TaxID=259542 RepID=A0AAV3Y2R5_9GAST|nr:hypothetical protein PoB_000366500 [Plakobranchus ocellatus]
MRAVPILGGLSRPLCYYSILCPTQQEAHQFHKDFGCSTPHPSPACRDFTTGFIGDPVAAKLALRSAAHFTCEVRSSNPTFRRDFRKPRITLSRTDCMDSIDRPNNSLRSVGGQVVSKNARNMQGPSYRWFTSGPLCENSVMEELNVNKHLKPSHFLL